MNSCMNHTDFNLDKYAKACQLTKELYPIRWFPLVDYGKDTGQKNAIKKALQGQAGIYGFVHKETYQTYVGSRQNLPVRLMEHLYPGAGPKGNKRTTEPFRSEFKKNGHGAYVVVIFKFVYTTNEYLLNPLPLIEWETTYLKAIRNKYNMLDYAHINSFFGQSHSEQFKKWQSDTRKGEKNPSYGKPKSVEFAQSQIDNAFAFGAGNPNSVAIMLTNQNTGVKYYFDSKIEAARWLGYFSKTTIHSALYGSGQTYNKKDGCFYNVALRDIPKDRSLGKPSFAPGTVASTENLVNPGGKAVILVNMNTGECLNFTSQIAVARFFGYKTKDPVTQMLFHRRIIEKNGSPYRAFYKEGFKHPLEPDIGSKTESNRKVPWYNASFLYG